ncbi:MAG: hypothetical protein R2828_24965 [Saprospiraceae bacterium]
MKYKSAIGTIIVGLFLLSPFGCKNESTGNSELLLGRWDIREAKRNGQTTESLDQLFFEFFQDGSMRTNILGTVEEATYQFDNTTLKQRESQVEIDYNVESLTDSFLVMTATINRFNFQFRLGKTIEEE